MTPPADIHDTLDALDDATIALVRLAAVVAAGNEDSLRGEISRAAGAIPDLWVEELLLQTYLFAGFPRALNAMREWRRVHPTVASVPESRTPTRADGEATCERVYGKMYDRLRENIRHLHPLLDDWMITEGYGKVLSRPGLDLPRREPCIVAAHAATMQSSRRGRSRPAPRPVRAGSSPTSSTARPGRNGSVAMRAARRDRNAAAKALPSMIRAVTAPPVWPRH